MYASKGAVEQVYSELYGDVDSKAVERGSTISSSVVGKLGAFLSQISGEFSGELTKSEIKKINFDDDMLKAKRLANELLADEEIPSVSKAPGQLVSHQLYRFSAEVETRPFESEVDGETYIQVAGEVGDVRFRGDTSTDNWGLRSHIIQSVRAAKHGDTYPYQGLMWPLTMRDETDGVSEYDVDYLLICGPKRNLRDEWYDRRTL